MNQSRRKPQRIVAPILGFLFMGLALLVLWQQVYIRDWLTVQQNPPAIEVVQLADSARFSEYGSFLFYASLPEIDDTRAISEHCGGHEHESAVLGCFLNNRIYLYEVKETELAGINEVTAAHEMLHAAYHRLGDREKTEINRLLQEETQKQSGNAEFNERMKVYDYLSDEDRLNEYHSVIGTELADISSDLETYYDRYFSDRQSVVQMYAQYSGIFRQLEQEASNLAASLDRRATDINSRVSRYDADMASYNQRVQQFNARARSGDMSQAEFDSQRRLLVNEQYQLDQRAAAINSDIAAYERDRRRLDGISIHITELNQSIDSSVAPPAGVQ